jgi:hypothetical protein
MTDKNVLARLEHLETLTAVHSNEPRVRIQVVYVDPQSGKHTLGPLYELPFTGENARVIPPAQEDEQEDES